MAWRAQRKFSSLKEALNYFKTEYCGTDYDVRGRQILFNMSNFPHFIALNYSKEKRTPVLLEKIERGEVTLKNSKCDRYRLGHLPSIKLLYKHPDEIWQDPEDKDCEHYIKHFTSLRSEKNKAHTLLLKWNVKGYYWAISCHPISEKKLKKIKSTKLLWTSKSGVEKAGSSPTPPHSYKEDQPMPEKAPS